MGGILLGRGEQRGWSWKLTLSWLSVFSRRGLVIHTLCIS
ncbi:unnamed protein product [Arabidopsis halleri]